jgi:phage terminase large subunit GpA-like protein
MMMRKTQRLIAEICRQTLIPPPELTVSQWAERYRVLDNSSAFPGRWNNAVTPYLTGIMDEMCNPYTQKLIFVKPTQVGGTEALINILGWSIMSDSAAAMIVYPTDDLGNTASETRLQVLIDKCPELKALYIPRKSRRLEKRFKGMTLYIRSANSPSKLASVAVKRLFFDESDKFPSVSKKEASPIKLAEERTKTYPFTKKIYDNCTPTYTNAHIWQEKESADVERHFFVPCPNCGKEIELRWPQIKFSQDKKLTNGERAETALYYCQECDGAIEDIAKPMMLKKGRWKEAARRIGGNQHPKKVAFWMNTLYSPFVTWADIAKEFLDSHRDLELLQNFVNSWLAEPWNFTTVKLNRDKVLDKTGKYAEGVVPAETILITGGVDVQQDRFYYTIRAWGEDLTSWNLRHGCVETWTEIENVMNQVYYSDGGGQYFVNLCAVDSGFNTDEVYDFCTQNSEWAIPIKGSSTDIKQKYAFTAIDRDNRGRPGIILYTVDGGYYKTFTVNRMAKNSGEAGCWYVYEGCDADYGDQVTSEEKVLEKRGGRTFEIWRTKTEHTPNHYWDAEVYAAFAADKLGIRYMRRNEAAPKKLPLINNAAQTSEESWISHNEKWV